MRPAAVTFDYWNTIVRTRADPSVWRIGAWESLLTGWGHQPSEGLLAAVFDAEWTEHDAAWQRNEQYTGVRAARSGAARLGFPLAAAQIDELVEVFCAAGQPDDFQLCPGVDEAIGALRDAGIRLGIICDVGFTPSLRLRELLEHHQLLDAFTGWSFSDEVGWYKPAPEIFRHAGEYLGASPAETVHIGDLRRTDIAGARAMGITAIRYCGVNDDLGDGPEGDHVLADYADLPAVLGLS